MTIDVADLKPTQFRKISGLLYQRAGIHLKPGKEALVRARLMKRLRTLGIPRVEDYLALLDADEGGAETARLIDVMTTNKTSFFREMDHFRYLRDSVLPELGQTRLRFWSAACSSGEEPYSLAMLLREHLADIDRRDVRILATDISRRMLAKARRAQYPRAAADEAPEPRYRKYFTAAPGAAGGVEIRPDARALVHLAYLNLMDPWPMRGRFQVVFCRNVMIYFDRPTQQRLIDRFWDVLEEGGHLFVGHSEGLSAVRHRFRGVRPAVYRK